ncbi:MAG: hypothetical protein ACM3JH_15855, partial [Acidithiobacillales bacterium]
MRGAKRPRRPDAALTGLARRRPSGALLLAAAALAALAAVAARFLPVSPAALEARASRFIGETRRALDADAARMQAVAGAIQRSSGFAGVVDGGGAEVRPSRLFSILSGALPKGSGWGIVFLDAADRAVAWAGEPIEIEEDVLRPDGGLAVAFHASRFTLAWSSPRTAQGERRGLLVVSRRYPTGLLRPDLIELFGLPSGPTRLRIRAAASGTPDRFVRLSMERASPDVAREDAARARARFPSIVAAALVALLGIVARRPRPALLAARLLLLLGTPRTDTGIWQLFPRAGALDLGLLGTPADVFLTGLLALALLRLAWPSASLTPAPAIPASVRLLLGLPLSLLPYLLGLVVGKDLPDLFSSMNLVPEDLATWLVQTGGVALAVAAVGATALLWAPLMTRRRPGPLLLLGTAILVAAAFGDGRGPAAALPVLAAVALGLALAGRSGTEAKRDLLGRAATAVFLVSAGCALGGIGLAHGKTRRVDAALKGADTSRPAGTSLA